MPLASPLAGTVEALLAPRLEQRILPGLERIERTLELLGRPERSFPSLLVVGTNGKGSTAALLAGILRAHGPRVGLYTSPHLVRAEERIQVDGTPVESTRLRELMVELNRFPELSYFETLTAAAILEFAERRIDIAVLEAGLGGRWDATNAVDPRLALLTNVGTDHQGWLGPTRAHIAAEKAAALRGREGIVAAWDDEVEGVIRASTDPATPLSLASQWASVEALPGPHVGTDTAVRFSVAGLTGDALLPLAGAHQLVNLTLALAGAAALAKHGVTPPLRSEAIARGIEGVRWPGRLQWVGWKGRSLLLDGAHNREAVQALAAALDTGGLTGRLHLLFSCLSDKPIEAMAALLRPRVSGVFVAPIDSPRATPLAELAAAFPGGRAFPTIDEALAALPGDLPTLVTGSLRLVGEVLARIEKPHG